MRAQNVEGSNMSIYGACFQDRVSHETDSAGQTHSTRQREPQISPLLRVEVRFCRPPLPAGHPDHRKPHPMFKPCARANGKGDNHRCHRCAAAWKLDRRTVPKQPSTPCPLIVKPASWQPSTMNDVNCLSSTRALGTGGRPDHGPKNGATNLEAGLVNLELRPHFWVLNLALFSGSQNTHELVHVLPPFQCELAIR